jgi:hypothetical protein
MYYHWYLSINDVFSIIPNFIDINHPEQYLCEKVILDNGSIFITVKDNKTFELLFESLET